MRMQTLACLEDMRSLARRRVPRMFYDYMDAGSWSQSTLYANRRDFDALMLRQRIGCDVVQRNTATCMLGRQVSMPVALAPTGLAGLIWANGEILGARAAEAFGVPFVLSMMSICALEEVCAVLRAPCWFQLYPMRDRGIVEALIERATRAGCAALVLTLDVPFLGQRHADLRNGLSVPPRLKPAALLDFLAHPRWALGMLRTRRRCFGNLVDYAPARNDLRTLSSWTAQQFDAGISWEDVAWIRSHWRRTLVVKGVLDAEDARQAIAAGADALVVSNHGGRQLDGACSSVRALPAIAELAAGRADVHLDSGIRCGQDVLKALALGASATYIGRAWLYGLAAMGEAGVAHVLSLIQRELELTMALCGRTEIAAIDRDILLG